MKAELRVHVAPAVTDRACAACWCGGQHTVTSAIEATLTDIVARVNMLADIVAR